MKKWRKDFEEEIYDKYNNNRRFICIEKDKEYYEKSIERLNEVKQQIRLF